jgi:hypothetical protein
MELKYVAVMLRQQQAEIESLKLQVHTTLTNRDLRTYDGKTEIFGAIQAGDTILTRASEEIRDGGVAVKGIVIK